MPRASAENGAGSIMAVALIAAVLALTGLSIPLYLALTTKSLVHGAADAAALAAADARSGAVGGYPCEVAATVASANGAELVECTVDGLVATVTVGRAFLTFDAIATATAGPPGGMRN